SLERWVQKATNHYQAVQETIKEAQCLYRQYNLYAAIQYLVIEDQTFPHLVSSLRVVLNALQKYFAQKQCNIISFKQHLEC
ncbi:hypothetical protein HNQ69_001678, partial [Bartonella callosciuri]|nr:hypothetical protein [Bartonella callosciuri]